MTDIPEKAGQKQVKRTKKDTQFKPGQSGNPKGKPKGVKNFDTLFEEAVKKIVKEKKLPIGDPEVEMVTRAVIEALKGDYAFFRDIMDRRYGKPRQPMGIEHSGEIKGLPTFYLPVRGEPKKEK